MASEMPYFLHRFINFFSRKIWTVGKNHPESKVLRIAQRIHRNFFEAFRAIFSILQKFTICKIKKIAQSASKKFQCILWAILRTFYSWWFFPKLLCFQEKNFETIMHLASIVYRKQSLRCPTITNVKVAEFRYSHFFFFFNFCDFIDFFFLIFMIL